MYTTPPCEQQNHDTFYNITGIITIAVRARRNKICDMHNNNYCTCHIESVSDSYRVNRTTDMGHCSYTRNVYAMSETARYSRGYCGIPLSLLLPTYRLLRTARFLPMAVGYCSSHPRLFLSLNSSPGMWTTADNKEMDMT